MARIPDKLINFMVYKDGKAVGAADVELPEITSMSDTLSGAGIAGEMDTPTLGQLESMQTTINFKTATQTQFDLLAPKGHMLEFRGSMQLFDSAEGRPIPKGLKVTMKVAPKSTGLGSLATAESMDSSSELEVTYLKIAIEGEEVLEIDKLNFIYKINGIDYLEKVREDLGLN